LSAVALAQAEGFRQFFQNIKISRVCNGKSDIREAFYLPLKTLP
jgi:hypothetical protein